MNILEHKSEFVKEITIMNDKEILLDIVKQLTEAHSGTEFTKHWTDDTLWFDVPAYAAKGKRLAIPVLDEEFASLKSISVSILSADVHVSSDMGFVASILKWDMVGKDGTLYPPMFVRQTDCFEKKNDEWKIVHEHTSTPSDGEWDGVICE